MADQTPRALDDADRIRDPKAWWAGYEAGVAAIRAEAGTLDVERDAQRYRRLRVLGVALYGSRHLNDSTVVRFTGLDDAVDDDIDREPYRGEAEYARPTEAER